VPTSKGRGREQRGREGRGKGEEGGSGGGTCSKVLGGIDAPATGDRITYRLVVYR